MTNAEWTKELEELREFFNTNEIPKGPIKFNEFGTIHNPETFIKTNLSVSSLNVGNPWHLASLDRLRWMRDYISQI